MSPPSARRLFMHGGVYGSARLFNQALAFLLLPLYAHFLGDEGFGLVSLMSTVGAFAGLVFIQGLHGAWFRLRFDEPDPSGIRALESTIVWYLAATGLLGIAVISLLGDGLASLVTPGIPYVPLGLLTTVAAVTAVYPGLLERKLQAEERAMAFGVFNVARSAVTIGLILGFVAVLGRGARGQIEATALASALSAAVALWLIRPASPAHFSRRRLLRGLAYGLPLVPHTLAGLTNDLIDRVLLSQLLGLSATGVYSMGYRIAAVGQVVGTALNQALSTMFVRAMKEAEAVSDAEKRRETMRRLGDLGLLLVAGVGICVLVVAGIARELIMVLATPAFSESWTVVAPVGAGVIAWACYFPLSQAIFYEAKRARWMFGVSGLAAAANVAGNLVLIPRYGIMGAAYATLASDVAMVGLAYVLARYCVPVEYHRRRWACVLGLLSVGLLGIWWIDASLGQVWPRVGLKVAIVLAAAALVAWQARLTPGGPGVGLGRWFPFTRST